MFSYCVPKVSIGILEKHRPDICLRTFSEILNLGTGFWLQKLNCFCLVRRTRSVHLTRPPGHTSTERRCFADAGLWGRRVVGCTCASQKITQKKQRDAAENVSLSRGLRRDRKRQSRFRHREVPRFARHRCAPVVHLHSG